MRFFVLGRLVGVLWIILRKIKKNGKTLRQLAIKAVTLQCANARVAAKPHGGDSAAALGFCENCDWHQKTPNLTFSL